MNRWFSGRSFGLKALAGMSFLLLTASGAGKAAASPQLEIVTDPPLAEVVPFEQPITISLSATEVPLENARLQIKLLTPAKTPWLTTDFPVVEGTTLLDMAVTPVDGEAQFQVMPPIRGRYQLQVIVTPAAAGAFTPFMQTLDFTVPDNPLKYRNLLILLAILAVAGVGGGWVIGGSQQLEAGEYMPERVRLLLSAAAVAAIGTLLYIMITAEQADAHTDSQAATSPVESQAHPAGLSVSLEDLAIAQVGQAIPLAVKVADAATGQPLTEIDLAIATRLLEYDRTVSAFQARPDTTGRYTWNQQFFDGSAHVVTVRVSPQADAAVQFEPFDLVKRIEVAGVAPPMSVRLISLGYLTAFLAAGVGVGFFARRRLQQPGS